MEREFEKYKKKGREREIRTPNPSILIVCEGAETEPNYFGGLRKYRKIQRELIHVIPGTKCKGNDPSNLIRCAREKKKSLESRGQVCDQTWIVFDDDNRPDVQQHTAKAERQGFKVAFSNPCFELWYLLHFDRQTAHIDSDDCKKQLCVAGRLPGYEKNHPSMYKELRHLQTTAIENARHLRERHENNGDPATSNPSTTVDQLVEVLEKLKK